MFEFSRLVVLHKVLNDDQLDDRRPVVVHPQNVAVKVVKLIMIRTVLTLVKLNVLCARVGFRFADGLRCRRTEEALHARLLEQPILQ